MAENLENKKAIEDIQATSDEAARLLASLESGPKDEDSTLPRQNSTNKPKTASQTISINAQPTANGSTWVGAIISFIIILITLASYSQQNYSQQTIGQPNKKRMTASQKQFYDQTIIKANNAVLKREHESAIMSLETLNSSKYKNLAGVDNGLINNKIIQAKKQIKFLDQPGINKYWETSNYGAQWFNKADGQFKLFFAYSRKCRSPVITFGFKRTSNGPNLATHTIRPSKYLSNLYIPFKLGGRQYITLDKFKCN